MIRYSFNAGYCLVLSTVLCASAFSNEVEEKAAWVSFAEIRTGSETAPKVFVQATTNVDPKVLKVISSFVHRAMNRPMQLVAYSEADMRIGTERFVVFRFMGKKLTITTGSRYPAASSRSLTRRLARMGYDVELVAPEKLLLRTNPSDGRSAEFIVPFGDASSE